MNRKIKFRGKRVDNGEWVYGFLIYDFSESYHSENYLDVPPRTYQILDLNGNRYTVNPETMGQLLGYGVYEGDIMDIRGDGKLRVAEYDEMECGATLTPYYEARTFGELGVRGRLDVVGNIHDNPELIK